MGSRGDGHLADVTGDQGAGRGAAGDWGVPGDVEGDVFQREELREGNTPFRRHSLGLLKQSTRPARKKHAAGIPHRVPHKA